MAKLAWDAVGDKLYELGVDRGVLYPQSDLGLYPTGYVWNGLTAVTESPSGAESSPSYADNIKYIDLISPEEFGGTIEAYTYPDEFAECDGSKEPVAGMIVGQQSRKRFGFSYRTKIGNDVAGQDLGYKLHLVYGALASPSEKAYATINDSPEAITFSWEFSTIAAATAQVGLKPIASIVIDSTKVNAARLALLEDELYGTTEDPANLPLPDAVIALLTPAGP